MPLKLSSKFKLVLLLILISNHIATISYAESSTDIIPTSTKPLIKCPVLTVNPATNPNQVYTYGGTKGTSLGYVQDFTTGCSSPNTITNPPGLVLVLGIIGGNMNPACTDDYPFIGGISENWIIPVLLAGGNTQMTLRCCQTPQPVITMQSDSTTWMTQCE